MSSLQPDRLQVEIDDFDDRLWRILANRARRVILRELQSAERSISELQRSLAPMSRFGVSKHLRALEAAGLVVGARRGKKKCFSLADTHWSERISQRGAKPRIRHRVGILVPRPRVYRALTTVEDLTAWLANDAHGDPSPIGTLTLFKDSFVVEIRELAPDSHVMWHCVKGPDDLVGTDMDFDLRQADGETVLTFAHSKWRIPNEYMYHCSTKWATYLLSLKVLLEGGAGAPYPHDYKISAACG